MKFEEYLQTVFAKNYMGTDDDMPNRFEGWLENRDITEMIKLGDEFAENEIPIMKTYGKERLIDLKRFDPYFENIKLKVDGCDSKEEANHIITEWAQEEIKKLLDAKTKSKLNQEPFN